MSRPKNATTPKAEPPPPAHHCTERTKAGKPCHGAPLAGETRCFVHTSDPAAQARIAAARVAGGKVRGAQLARLDGCVDPENPPAWWNLATVAQTGDGLAHVARAVLTRDLDSRAANAATQALSALTKARENDIERRVIALENLLANLPSK